MPRIVTVIIGFSINAIEQYAQFMTIVNSASLTHGAGGVTMRSWDLLSARRKALRMIDVQKVAGFISKDVRGTVITLSWTQEILCMEQ